MPAESRGVSHTTSTGGTQGISDPLPASILLLEMMQLADLRNRTGQQVFTVRAVYG